MLLSSLLLKFFLFSYIDIKIYTQKNNVSHRLVKGILLVIGIISRTGKHIFVYIYIYRRALVRKKTNVSACLFTNVIYSRWLENYKLSIQTKCLHQRMEVKNITKPYSSQSVTKLSFNKCIYKCSAQLIPYQIDQL